MKWDFVCTGCLWCDMENSRLTFSASLWKVVPLSPLGGYCAYPTTMQWVSVPEVSQPRSCLLLFSHSIASLRPHGLQHTRLPCPSPSPGVWWNSCHWVGDWTIKSSHWIISSVINSPGHLINITVEPLEEEKTNKPATSQNVMQYLSSTT